MFYFKPAFHTDNGDPFGQYTACTHCSDELAVVCTHCTSHTFRVLLPALHRKEELHHEGPIQGLKTRLPIIPSISHAITPTFDMRPLRKNCKKFIDNNDRYTPGIGNHDPMDVISLQSTWNRICIPSPPRLRTRRCNEWLYTLQFLNNSSWTNISIPPPYCTDNVPWKKYLDFSWIHNGS